ncbi:DNA methyltransferase [Mycobacterium sp. SMC-4]|uniref:DNA methyltransferase n=1 Tax=Mycobacterium sp. SMC-4 TaxID=2857059 RepID=UPI003CFE76D1
MRPELAAWAVDACTNPGDRVYDPFCGSGTVLLEAQSQGRIATGTDLNPYAVLLSEAKVAALNGALPSSGDDLVEKYLPRVDQLRSEVSSAEVSEELRSMYHPDTLISLLAWVKVLKDENDSFGLACLMGIAHHQRPGFLSFPASHTVPYLRSKSFPKELFPELYEYRDVESRLARKIDRAISRLPALGKVQEEGIVLHGDSGAIDGESLFDAIITSPPYMGQLHYGRDNRIRLELLGYPNWQYLDSLVSPRLNVFLDRSIKWLADWSRLLKPGGTLCILAGDKTNTTRRPFAGLVDSLVLDSGESYKEVGSFVSPIPSRRRVRKGCEGSTSELLLQYQIIK